MSLPVALYILLLNIVLYMTDVASQTSFNAHLSKDPKLTLGLQHKSKSGRWTFSGNGWTDFRGNWGAGLGVSLRFRKRSVRLPSSNEGRFYLVIRIDPCDFSVYDTNEDGVITKDEIFELFFPDKDLVDKLILALDIGIVDGHITEDEFSSGAAKYISGCQNAQNEELKTLKNKKH